MKKKRRRNAAWRKELSTKKKKKKSSEAVLLQVLFSHLMCCRTSLKLSFFICELRLMITFNMNARYSSKHIVLINSTLTQRHELVVIIISSITRDPGN